MAEDSQIQQMKGELERLRHVVSEHEIRLASDEVRKEVAEIRRMIRAGDEDRGKLTRSVDRLSMLIDGNESFGSVGLVHRIQVLETEIVRLVQQRTQVKWAAIGVLLVTTLGNANGIAQLAKELLLH